MFCNVKPHHLNWLRNNKKKWLCDLNHLYNYILSNFFNLRTKIEFELPIFLDFIVLGALGHYYYWIHSDELSIRKLLPIKSIWKRYEHLLCMYVYIYLFYIGATSSRLLRTNFILIIFRSKILLTHVWTLREFYCIEYNDLLFVKTMGKLM